jgi:hypothetical protein
MDSKFKKVIYVERGNQDVSVLVEARVFSENGRLYLREFESELPLREVEQEMAKEELIDRAHTVFNTF